MDSLVISIEQQRIVYVLQDVPHCRNREFCEVYETPLGIIALGLVKRGKQQPLHLADLILADKSFGPGAFLISVDHLF